MASTGLQHDSDDDMDDFMEKFKTMKYKNAFNEDNWEEVRNDRLLLWITALLAHIVCFIVSVSNHKHVANWFSPYP